jgi:hypothetical protein
MKYCSLVLIAFVFASCNAQHTTPVSKSDLQKIKWIEGSWKGLYNNTPFYEHYRFANDSTIEVTSFEWDGKDTSKSSVSRVQWADGNYYLGDKRNWQVRSITDTSIYMTPKGSGNDILWKFVAKDRWQAILKTKNGMTSYDMVRFDLSVHAEQPRR